MKILGMEYNDNSINELSKFVKRSEIHLVNIHHEERAVTIDPTKVEFFKSDNIFEQLRIIDKLKDKYDLCVVSSWKTAALAFLADLNYIISFIGHDIRTPPFIKNTRPEYFKNSVNNLNFFERSFYKKVLDNALVCVTGGEELFNCLKKYRKDAIRIDRAIMDIELFNQDVKPINSEKKKFTFFCPQRIGKEKGSDIIWDALNKCKADFEFLQIDWIDNRTIESKNLGLNLIKNKPAQVKLIPKISRKEMPKYFSFADAIIGDMFSGLANNTEREASLCKKPVIFYYDPKKTYLLNGQKIQAPFIPRTNNPQDLADIIDKVVTSKNFRDELAEKEFNFSLEIGDPYKAAKEWEDVFEKSLEKIKSIKKNSSFMKRFSRKMLYIFGSGLHFRTESILP